MEELVSGVYEMLNTVCDAAMPRRTVCRRRSPCYWWNDEIRNLRSAKSAVRGS